ncbi:tektin-3-like [Plakobranchus ocellatus]|uniref:Tektin n=1 Tax=Plakobranchus ocellatus TaxID=259542 RepID=A0AAV4CTV2_9GAST|nr:tektin-3-like [Plakobranchus ocellatus]
MQVYTGQVRVRWDSFTGQIDVLWDSCSGHAGVHWTVRIRCDSFTGQIDVHWDSCSGHAGVHWTGKGTLGFLYWTDRCTLRFLYWTGGVLWCSCTGQVGYTGIPLLDRWAYTGISVLGRLVFTGIPVLDSWCTLGFLYWTVRANVQLGLNRAAQHELERDSGDKFIAHNLDTTSQQLRMTSRGIAYHDGVHRIDNSISVPETWAKYTNDNIQRSQAERSASKQMRNEIETVLNTCNNEMWQARIKLLLLCYKLASRQHLKIFDNPHILSLFCSNSNKPAPHFPGLLLQQWNSVNTALSNRIQESTDARNKLHSHLSKTLQEIYDMEKNIELLKKAIQEKERAMQVAQTRLDTRLRRPNVELCRDAAHNQLVEEVSQLIDTVDHLQHRLREAENALQALLRTKGALEQDLSIKNNTLFIDREKCMAMRKTFPIAPRLVAIS